MNSAATLAVFALAMALSGSLPGVALAADAPPSGGTATSATGTAGSTASTASGKVDSTATTATGLGGSATPKALSPTPGRSVSSNGPECVAGSTAGPCSGGGNGVVSKP